MNKKLNTEIKLDDKLIKRFAKAMENLKRIEGELAQFPKKEEGQTINTIGKWKKASLIRYRKDQI